MRKREFVKFFGALQNEYGMSPNRIASLKSAVSSLSNYIENILDDEFPTFKNIVKSIPIAQKQAVREKTILSEEDIQNILDKLVELKKYEVACFFACGISSGARKAEILQMRVDDFTDEHKVLSDKYWLTAPMRTKGRGKKGKILKKYVAIESFKPYLDLWMKQREELGIDCEFLFTAYNKGHYEKAGISTANSWADTISRLTGIDFFFHSLRHAYTTFARRNKVPDTVIQKMVGWQSLDMLNIYDDRDETEEIEDYFAEMKGDDNE